jgi:hypothetical protein
MNYKTPFLTRLSNSLRCSRSRLAVRGFTHKTILTLPLGFRPAPLRRPPLLVFIPLIILLAKFEPQQIVASAPFISGNLGITKHGAFAAQPADVTQEIHPLFWTFHFVKWNGGGIWGGLDSFCGALHSFIPGQTFPRQIKHGELNRVAGSGCLAKPFSAVAYGDSRSLKAVDSTFTIPTGPYFSVQRGIRKPFCEPARRIDHIAAPGPKLIAIPIGAAAVEFFARKPASDPLASQIHCQSHIGLVYHFQYNKRYSVIVNT